MSAETLPDAEFSQTYIKLPESEPLEDSLVFIGGGLFLLGSVLLTLVVIYEYFAEIRQRKRALILRDAMIRAPRCEQKSNELGMIEGKNWKDYFTSEQPFYE